MFRKLFQRTSSQSDCARATVLTGPRVPRHSSGWAAMLKHMKDTPSLRVLDIGPTSSLNINFLTSLGHSVYMADLVHESLTGPWALPPEEEGGPPGFEVAGFFEQNLNFSGREFDVVLLWNTLDYIPQDLVQPLIERLKNALNPGGRVLAVFHRKATGPNTGFCRYHLTGTDEIEMQDAEPHPVQRVYTNRKIEELFSDFSNSRFFLAQDNLYEVLITR